MWSNKQAIRQIKRIVESDEKCADDMVSEVQEIINRTEGENEMNDEKYDYEKAVKSDILDYIKEHHESGFISQRTRDELYDDMFVSDSVTGNASGSYTFNTWRAESNLCHNSDLMEEVISVFGYEDSRETRGAEWWDVSIRCMLLGRLLDEVVDEWNETNPEEDAD